MRILPAFLLLIALAACGAAGKPTAPGPESGVQVSGDARIGVVVGK